MKIKTLLAAMALPAAALAASPAFATYTVTVVEASTGGGINATKDEGYTLAAMTNSSAAAFGWNGALNFSNTAPQNTDNTGDLNSLFFGSNAANLVNYTTLKLPTSSAPYLRTGAGFDTATHFLNTSGSVAGYGWASLYDFDSGLGSFGGQTLTITHDDGVSLYLNGSSTAFGGFTSGPTTAITESVVLPTGTTRYEIVYSRQNGTPSILTAGLSGAVPEPASWAMMISGFGLVGGAMRRSRRTAAFA